MRDVDLVVEAELGAARALLGDAIWIDASTPVLALPETAGRTRIEITSLRAGAQNLEEDLRLRDFTLNAAAYDPRRRRYVDPLGGIDDLASRTLRATDPDRSFRDDPIRILRGIRLTIDLDLQPEPATERAMSRDSWLLHDTAAERRRDELYRLLSIHSVEPGIERLRQLGALPALLPELLRLIGISQNRHHPEDVYSHSLRVCGLLRADPVLRLAALLHDAAKADTKQLSVRTGDFSFHRHELRAAGIAAGVGGRLRLSNSHRSALERLIRHHLLFPERLATERSVSRMLRRVGSDILPDLLALRRADLAARHPTGECPPEWLATEERIREGAYDSYMAGQQRLAIGGKEIMQELGVPEGREVGLWLRRARRRALENPEENDRGKLLAWLRSTITRQPS